MPSEKQVGVAVTRCVPLAMIGQFEDGLHDLINAASRYCGHISAEILRGAVRPEGRWYYIIYRFSDEPGLRAWESSPERQSLLARVDRLAVERWCFGCSLRA